jgi:hypothetical protein
MDPTDFSAQIYLSSLLGIQQETDFVALGRLAAKSQLAMYKSSLAYLHTKKTDLPPTLPLASYVGTYLNEAHFAMVVTVSPLGSGLHVSTQGSALITYDLLPWDKDTFYWEVDQEQEICEKGMFPDPIAVKHLMSFDVSGKIVESLKWRHEMAWKDAEVFHRSDTVALGNL